MRCFQSALLLSLPFALGAACEVPQAEPCARWLACLEALDAEDGGGRAEKVRPAYGEEGTCWTSEEAAESCAENCEDALESLRQLENAPEACRAP